MSIGGNGFVEIDYYLVSQLEQLPTRQLLAANNKLIKPLVAMSRAIESLPPEIATLMRKRLELAGTPLNDLIGAVAIAAGNKIDRGK